VGVEIGGPKCEPGYGLLPWAENTLGRSSEDAEKGSDKLGEFTRRGGGSENRLLRGGSCTDSLARLGPSPTPFPADEDMLSGEALPYWDMGGEMGATELQTRSSGGDGLDE
jgi:hypothetical protein